MSRSTSGHGPVRAYIRLWVDDHADDRKSDARLVATSLRAIEGVVVADALYDGDVMAVVEAVTLDELDGALDAIAATPGVSVHDVDLARRT